MIKIGKILFPTDFYPCSAQALDHALDLADVHGAELHMLHAIVLHEEDPHNPAHHFEDLDAIHRRLADVAAKAMRAAVKERGRDGVTIEMVQERGISAADTILAYARENDIDLVVMGTHGRRGLGHLFLGSVAEEVVRLAPCPVLTVRELPAPIAVRRTARIVAPIDFSDHAFTALRYAKELAAPGGAEVMLLHVIEEAVHPVFYGTGKTSILAMRPDIHNRSKGELERIFRECPGPEVRASFHSVIGRASREISAFAKERDADMIVIATHGVTGIQHFMLGSVAEKVVRRAACRVFAVKPFGRSLLSQSP